jgi:hypothetical protein
MKPYWPRTLQLLPVHIQARDAYVERLLALRAEQSIPDAYGFTDLAIDETGLARGEIVLRGFEAVLPNGLVVAGEKSAAPLARVAADVGAIGAAQTVVYLAVPTTLTRGPNAGPTSARRRALRGRRGTWWAARTGERRGCTRGPSSSSGTSRAIASSASWSAACSASAARSGSSVSRCPRSSASARPRR